jgi:hypothetical protein
MDICNISKILSSKNDLKKFGKICFVLFFFAPTRELSAAAVANSIGRRRAAAWRRRRGDPVG